MCGSLLYKHSNTKDGICKSFDFSVGLVLLNHIWSFETPHPKSLKRWLVSLENNFTECFLTIQLYKMYMQESILILFLTYTELLGPPPFKIRSDTFDHTRLECGICSSLSRVIYITWLCLARITMSMLASSHYRRGTKR